MMGKPITAELLGRALLTKACTLVSLKGQWDGPGGKVACHQSWRFEFNPRNYLVEGENQCLQVLPSVSCGMHSWLGVGIISLCKLCILKLGKKLSWGKEDHQMSVQRMLISRLWHFSRGGKPQKESQLLPKEQCSLDARGPYCVSSHSLV